MMKFLSVTGVAMGVIVAAAPSAMTTPTNAAGLTVKATAAVRPPTDPQPQIPGAWLRTGSNDGYAFLTDHQTVHTGSSSAVLFSSDRRTESMTAVFEACSATDFRGRRAKFSIYLFGEDDFGSAEAWIRVDDPMDRVDPVKLVRISMPLPNPPAWAPASVTIDVPSKATVITYGVILHGPGPLWMDTARLAILDEQGGERDEPSPEPRASVTASTSSAPRYPRNMDFEEFGTADR